MLKVTTFLKLQFTNELNIQTKPRTLKSLTVKYLPKFPGFYKANQIFVCGDGTGPSL